MNPRGTVGVEVVTHCPAGLLGLYPALFGQFRAQGCAWARALRLALGARVRLARPFSRWTVVRFHLADGRTFRVTSRWRWPWERPWDEDREPAPFPAGWE